MKTRIFTIWNYEEPNKYLFKNIKVKEGTTKDV